MTEEQSSTTNETRLYLNAYETATFMLEAIEPAAWAIHDDAENRIKLTGDADEAAKYLATPGFTVVALVFQPAVDKLLASCAAPHTVLWLADALHESVNRAATLRQLLVDIGPALDAHPELLARVNKALLPAEDLAREILAEGDVDHMAHLIERAGEA